MSNNTNTLFWVITGAVIIVAVFLLVNNSSTNILQVVSDKFSNITAEGGIESNLKNEVSLPELSSDYIEVNACGTKRIYVGGVKVEIYGVYYLKNGGTHVRWFITNTTNEVIDKRLTLYFYNCETNKMVLDLQWNIGMFEPKYRAYMTTGASDTLKDMNYYIKAKLE